MRLGQLVGGFLHACFGNPSPGPLCKLSEQTKPSIVQFIGLSISTRLKITPASGWSARTDLKQPAAFQAGYLPPDGNAAGCLWVLHIFAELEPVAFPGCQPGLAQQFVHYLRLRDISEGDFGV